MNHILHAYATCFSPKMSIYMTSAWHCPFSKDVQILSEFNSQSDKQCLYPISKACIIPTNQKINTSQLSSCSNFRLMLQQPAAWPLTNLTNKGYMNCMPEFHAKFVFNPLKKPDIYFLVFAYFVLHFISFIEQLDESPVKHTFIQLVAFRLPIISADF